MTELERSRQTVLQHGDFAAQSKPFTDLAAGTELIIQPGLTEEASARLWARGVVANTSPIQGQDASRVFITAGYAEQAGLPVDEKGALDPASVRKLLQILSSEE